MKNFLKIFFVSAVLTFLFTECKKENMCDCFKSTGKDITIERDLSSFDTIYVKDKVDVYLVEDVMYKVEIVGGSNLVGLVKTDVSSNKLLISNDNKCNFVRSYKRKLKIYVHAPKLKWIVHNGVGTIYCQNTLINDTIFYQVFNSGDLHLNVNNSYVRGAVNGMGDVYLSGTTYEHLTNVNGEGFLYATELSTHVSDLYLKTSGISKIYATDRLTVILEESGDLYYSGNPAVITKNVTGTGKLIPY